VAAPVTPGEYPGYGHDRSFADVRWFDPHRRRDLAQLQQGSSAARPELWAISDRLSIKTETFYLGPLAGRGPG